MKKKKLKYNAGGAVNNPSYSAINQIGDIASAFGPAGNAIGAGIKLANQLLTNPSNYNPVRQNTTAGYNNGGPITPMRQESTTVQTALPFNADDFYLPKQHRQSNPSFMNRLGWSDSEQSQLNAAYANLNNRLDDWNKKLAASGLEGKPRLKEQTSMSGGAGGSYNLGGDINLNSGGAQIQGNPGIDNNARMVGDQPVNLTQGETIQATNTGAFVFSDSPDMLDPVSGKTFAKAAKPVQKAIGKAEKVLERTPTDPIAKATIRQSEKILEGLAQRQQRLNNNSQGEPSNFNYGGIVNAFRNASPYTQRAANSIPVAPIATLPLGSVSSQQVPAIPSLGSVPGTTQAAAVAAPQGFGTTLGDNVNLIADTASVLGRGIQAFQPVEQYNTDRYNVDRQIYNPTTALDKNTRNFNSQRFSTNSGNAALDSARNMASYAAKLNADRETIREYDAMQRQSDLQVNQINQQSRANVDNINDQNEGARQAAIDNVFTSVSNLGSEAQDYFNARTENNITLATLNSLSRRYGIDIDTLRKMKDSDPATFEKLLQYKG